MAEDAEGEQVEVEISIAEDVYVSIKTNRQDYERVLKDAKKIAKDLKDHLNSTYKLKERGSEKSYG